MTTVLQYYPNYPFQRKINGTITRTTISNISEESAFPANHELPIEKKNPIEVSISSTGMALMMLPTLPIGQVRKNGQSSD
jgi:hypothetical protein